MRLPLISSCVEHMDSVGRGSRRAMPYLVFARGSVEVRTISGGDGRKLCERHGSAGVSPYRASGMSRFIDSLALPCALAYGHGEVPFSPVTTA